jgi:heat shock protein HslJ/uncharacterized protein YecT (DUF1311 family)
MISSARLLIEGRFWRGPIVGAVLAGAVLATTTPYPAAADAIAECPGTAPDRSACLELLEREASAELAATLQAAVDLYAGRDAITGNRRASRTLRQGQAAFELYRDLDCHLVELQVGAGTNSADHGRACRIDHDRQRTSTLAARLPQLPAGAAADGNAQGTSTMNAEASGNGDTSETPAAAPILGSSWRVVEIEGEPVAEGVLATFAIDAEGSFSGSGGCNRYFGSAEIDGERIGMGDIGVTRMACPEPAMGEEQRFMKALDAVASWQIVADELTLADDSGRPLVRLARSSG